ncbi:protein BUNDLE SHEATH DEFECTIVE 2, chloroplastic [Actinidia eriantha]|uniref:protein BUNDLE SHEATH DEFECTIVE 2, chloroplastic n=1 Tax=Actinidia eriantha TaxID=165200 RepID=UPI0025880D5F|nr:protein BUNDLE SHEATH DEFECTIVE 2, chloroplastic [Actinidia eriantha]XP_057494510.1 protein BUNDLE SHEATH DEFECTIVE 2, chloroplastic [Actinidia eriantha]
MAGGGVPPAVRTLASAAAVILGGMLTLSLASSASIRALKAVTEAKRKKFALPCGVCKGKGFYMCKLCKGNSTIEWSPLYDPVFINPCVCPTCEGNRVQRCLNCLGKGYY